MRNIALNKKRIIFAAVAAVTAVLLIVAIVMCFIVPSAKNLVSPGGSEIITFAPSYTDDGRYIGDKSGNLVQFDLDGNEIASIKLSETAIHSVFTHRALDYVLVTDLNNILYGVRFGEGEPQLLYSGSIGRQVITMAADSSYLYLACTQGTNAIIRKYPKANPIEGGKPLAEGLLYTSMKTGSSWTLRPVKSATVLQIDVEGDELFVTTGSALLFNMSTDFEMNSFESMSQEELDAIGAIIGTDGRVTIGEAFDETKYSTIQMINAQRITAAAYDSRTKHLYIAMYTASGPMIQSFDRDYNLEAQVALRNEVQLGGVWLDENTSLIFAAYSTINQIDVIDLEEMDIRGAINADFNIQSMMTDITGERLYYLYQDSVKNPNAPNTIMMKSLDVDTMLGRGVIIALLIVMFVLGGLGAIATLVLGLSFFKEGFFPKLLAVLKDIVRNWIVYLILLGSLTMLILFCYYPGISSAVLSFFNYTREAPTLQFNNLKHYIEIFTSMESLKAFGNMFIFLGFDIILAIVPPLFFALCLVIMRSKRFGTFARVALFLPGVLPGIATLLIWKNGIYGIDGVINSIIKVFNGESVLFLQHHGMASLIMMGFPFVGSYLIFFGALMNLPSSYYEAAELDGCPVVRRIFMIDIPLISAQIKYVFILSFIASVQNFGRVQMTTQGQFDTQIPINLMYEYMQAGDYGRAAAYSTILFLVLIVITTLNLKLQTVDTEA